MTCSCSCFWTLYEHWQHTLDLFSFISLSVNTFCRSLHHERMWVRLSLGNSNICTLAVLSPSSSVGVERKKGEGKASFQKRRWLCWRVVTDSHMLRRSHFFTLSSPGNWCICGLDSFQSLPYFDFNLGFFMLKKYPLKSCPRLNHCKLIANQLKVILTLRAIYFVNWDLRQTSAVAEQKKKFFTFLYLLCKLYTLFTQHALLTPDGDVLFVFKFSCSHTRFLH